MRRHEKTTRSQPSPSAAPRFLRRRLRSFLHLGTWNAPLPPPPRPAPPGARRKCSYGSRRSGARLFAMATAGTPRRFCRCACFCSENLYVARYGLHVRFRGEQQLRRDYGPVSGLHWLCGEAGGRRSLGSGAPIWVPRFPPSAGRTGSPAEAVVSNE